MKKGFTLIELLAVIVILALIVLIAVPLIMNIITKVKKSAAESSTYNYIQTVETRSVFNEIGGDIEALTEGRYNVEDLKNTYKVNIKGSYPTKGTVDISSKGEISSATLCINDFEINYNGNYAKAVSDNCDNVSNETNLIYTNGTAIYFNPVNGTTCSYDEAVSTTGTKTGCMKWYAFNDSEANNTVNLILDHNTTAAVVWNSSGTNESGPNELLVQLASDTNSWAGVPNRTDSYSVINVDVNYTIDYSTYKARIMTASDIAEIINLQNFDETHYLWSSDILLGTGKDTSEYDTTNWATQFPDDLKAYQNNYSWLFDYTASCTIFGCNINDNSTLGYWLTTPVNHGAAAAHVTSYGSIYSSDITASSFGLRPIITIPKTLLS
ncbi:MAG: type II secretion system protein [Bacilli bacterium]|nr:type II secretion system protein [Bacilli bacterium]